MASRGGEDARARKRLAVKAIGAFKRLDLQASHAVPITTGAARFALQPERAGHVAGYRRTRGGVFNQQPSIHCTVALVVVSSGA
jgi:hypothetical protein